MAKGEGPVAVDAERASGFRYGHRAFLIQLRRRRRGHRAHRPGGLPGPVRSRCRAGRRRGGAARRLPGSALPGRARVPPAGGCSTPSWPGGCLASRGSASARWWSRCLGWTLEKGHAAADWSVRPLPAELLRYAALDVELLVELRDALAVMLAAQGKTEWARQEFAAVLAAKPPGPRPDPWRRTSGIHRVHSRRGLAIVRELWQERDKIARRRDMSPGRVLPDTAIVEAARALPGSPRQSSPTCRVPGPGCTPAHLILAAGDSAGTRPGRRTTLPGPAMPPAGRAPADPPLAGTGPGGGPAAGRGAHGGGGAGRRAHPPGREPAAARRGPQARLAAARADRTPMRLPPTWPPTGPGRGRWS